MLRVLHVIPWINPERGGPPAVVRAIAEGLVELGCEVVVAHSDDGSGWGRRQPIRADLHRGVLYRSFPQRIPTFAVTPAMGSWLRTHARDFDIMHIHSLFTYTSAAAGRAARASQVPYVLRPFGVLNAAALSHGRTRLKKLSLALFDRRLLRDAAAVHFSSHEEAQEADMYDLPRTVVIPNPVPLEAHPTPADATAFRGRYGIAAGAPMVLYLARLHPIKGLDLLLRAFAGMHRPDARLVVAGTGVASYVSELQALTRELEIEDAVVWTGFLSGRDRWTAYAASDVYVLPSASENFGITAAEAMGTGTPVVVTREVALQHEISVANAGRVTDRSVPELTGALVDLLDDPSTRRELGANGRKLVIRRFSREAVAESLHSLYQQLR